MNYVEVVLKSQMLQIKYIVVVVFVIIILIIIKPHGERRTRILYYHSKIQSKSAT